MPRHAETRKRKPDATRQREIKEVRASDIEPYTGLRYLSKLFRFMAVILVLLLVAEIATGSTRKAPAAIPTLLGEASRLIVLAGVLWGTGDLAHLLIDVGHDVRAARILVARVAHDGEGRADVHAPARSERRSRDRTPSSSDRFADRVDERDDLANRRFRDCDRLPVRQLLLSEQVGAFRTVNGDCEHADHSRDRSVHPVGARLPGVPRQPVD